MNTPAAEQAPTRHSERKPDRTQGSQEGFKVERDGDGFPCGWTLGRRSWSFHRTVLAVLGRSLECGEFGRLLRQTHTDPPIHQGLSVWRVKLDDGAELVVQRMSAQQFRQALPADWQPPADAAEAEVTR